MYIHCQTCKDYINLNKNKNILVHRNSDDLNFNNKNDKNNKWDNDNDYDWDAGDDWDAGGMDWDSDW